MRKKRRRQLTIMVVLIGISLVVVMLNTVDQIGDIAGNWTVITGAFIDYLPSIFFIGLGFTVLLGHKGNYSTQPARLMITNTIIGVGFSGLFHELNSDSIWIDEIVTASFTITDLQIITVLFFLFLGIIYGLIKK